MPVDDPTTHLELTMIHEALILENSGRNLALAEYAAALKAVVLLGLIGQVARSLIPGQTALTSYGLSLAMLLLAALVIVLAESTLVKLRWRRVPNLLSFAIGSAVLACLLVAVGG
jgi:formate hydrogenlyase subunit 4